MNDQKTLTGRRDKNQVKNVQIHKFNMRYICIILMAAFFGCSGPGELNGYDYLRALNSEGSALHISKTNQHIRFNARMQTPEMLTLMHGRKNYKALKEFEADRKNYEEQLNFIFLIEDEGKHHRVKETVFDEKTYGQLLAYANTELQNDFELELSN